MEFENTEHFIALFRSKMECDDTGVVLRDYLKENPAHAQIFIEHASKEIEIKLLEIQKVSLAVAYNASNHVSE